MPSRAALDYALAVWHDHPLLKGLWDSSGDCALKLISGSSEADKTTKFAQNPHPLNDHGLFIAGIIHSIAPKAQLYIIETINELGRGNTKLAIEMVNTALSLATSRNHTKAIINCSWHLPSKDELDAALPPNASQAAKDTYSRILQRINSLRTIMEPAAMSDSGNSAAKTIIVAAAGNDAKQALTPPQPLATTRSPADFTNVYGVGALNRDGTLTLYTDVADSAMSDADPGFVIYGGDVQPPDPQKLELITDKDNGILGLCITDFVAQKPDPADPDTWLWSPKQVRLGALVRDVVCYCRHEWHCRLARQQRFLGDKRRRNRKCQCHPQIKPKPANTGHD